MRIGKLQSSLDEGATILLIYGSYIFVTLAVISSTIRTLSGWHLLGP